MRPDGAATPLRSVLDAMTAGARSRIEVARRTGLSADVVDAAIDHLVRMGRLNAERMAVGCPSGGCGSCASGSDGAPGCGAPAAGADRSGPVLVQITLSGR